MRKLLVILLTLAGCSSPVKPTEAPFTKPSLLVGEYSGKDPNSNLVTLRGNGINLVGESLGLPIQVWDNNKFIVGNCIGTWDYISITEDGFLIANRTCVGGYWRFQRVNK